MSRAGACMLRRFLVRQLQREARFHIRVTHAYFGTRVLPLAVERVVTEKARQVKDIPRVFVNVTQDKIASVS
jgi:hypothetical protein